MIYVFEGGSLDAERRELRRGDDLVAVEPQVFDVLQHLIRNRDRVVSKDELIADVWNGRIVSESTLSSRISAVRHAVGDSGQRQRLIRTIARKGLRFVGTVQAIDRSGDDGVAAPGPPPAREESASSAMARPASPERRQLTIMVCELIGTLALSTTLDPEDLREVVAAYEKCIAGVAERHGGFVAQYTGDRVHVYFGYPQAHEDDAEHAVQAALAVVAAVGGLSAERTSAQLRARVAIATGLVVVGESPGVAGPATHDAVGEAPHAAAHLLDIADAGMVVIAASTRQLVGSLFNYRDLGAVKLEGVAEPLGASQVLRESGNADRFEALRPARTELIGRAEELELLLRRWNRVRTGEGRVVLIWGEPGIGKSHLVAAFQDAIPAGHRARLRFFCSPHRTQTALYPVIAQLERAAGFATADDDDAKLDKLERMLAMSSQDVAGDAALFAELLAVSTAGRYSPLSVSAQRRKELLLERAVAQIAGLAAHGPVLVVLEDAHWADPTTREFFDLLIDRVRDLPVLLIMTYRPEFVPPWLGQSHVTALTLNRLGRRDNAALVKRLAGGRELPAELVEQIMMRTDGVPLFIEEVTKSVLESGLLRLEDGAFVLSGSLPVLAVPSTLQASLVARFDRIRSVRVLVQTCAALGREFSYPLLKRVMALPDDDLGPLLDRLVASGLVHQRGIIPNAVYAFKHALVQDAAYETMLKSQRAPIHEHIARILEQDFPDTATRHPDVLAYHCTEAGLWGKAIDFRLDAARMALDRSAGIEALAQVERASALLAKIDAGAARQPFEGRVQVALGDALIMTKGFASPEVMTALSRARELLDASTYPIESLRALCGLFNYHLIRSESPSGLALAAPFLERALDPPTATVINYLVGTARLHLGDFSAAIRHLEAALASYDETHCKSVEFVAGYHLRSFILIWLGLARLYVGSLGRAAETISAAVSDARSRSHPFTLVSALLALARFLNHTRDLQGAIEATEEGMAIATEQRSPYHLSRASILRGVNVVESGRPEEGIVLMERALAAHRETGANFQSSYNLSRLAEAHALTGRTELAIELADQALAEIVRTGERWWEAEAYRVKGEILSNATPARHDDAEACFRNALECARNQGALLWELHAARSLADLWSVHGRQLEAAELLAPVYGALENGPDTPDLQSAREMLARLGHHAFGDRREAAFVSSGPQRA